MWLILLGIVLLAWWRKRRTDPAVEPAPLPPEPARPIAAVTTLTAAYTVFTAWTFVAWYRKHRALSAYKWGGDGWLGINTYAGGADKFGHAWATMGLARLGTMILNGWGGFSRRKASLTSVMLSELFFAGVEVKDGFYYEFSFSDLTGNTVGAVLAALFDNFPRLNELFGYRVEYAPSEMYRRKLAGTSTCRAGACSRWNFAEDYSGQTYLTALHLAGIKTVRKRLGAASRFIDVAIGCDSRNYRPTPDADVTELPRQDVFLGLAFNAQGWFDWLLDDGRRSVATRRLRRITHSLFEVFNLPYGSVRLFGWSRERRKTIRAAPPISSLRRSRAFARATRAARRRRAR